MVLVFLGIRATWSFRVFISLSLLARAVLTSSLGFETSLVRKLVGGAGGRLRFGNSLGVDSSRGISMASDSLVLEIL